MIATRARLFAVLVALTMTGCSASTLLSPSPTASDPSAEPSPGASASAPETGSLVIVGRILTMDDPPVAEAILIEDGTVTAVGTRDEVLALAGDVAPVIDIGSSVAYPGFIDAHAHWIGDRDYYHIETPAAAMDAALERGWTSISEQWINPEKLDLLLGLAADDAMPIRVDAYLALNFDKEFLGDWYVSREPGPVDDRLRVRGLKIHLDDGGGNIVNWEQDDLTATIGRADEAGWQVSVHAMSTGAVDMLLDAYEAAIGQTGPNPLHHRVEHAIQVTDQQLARLVAMDIATVIHLDGEPDWVLSDGLLTELDRDDPDQMDEIARFRDLVEAGLHVASATDAPWTFPDFKLTEDMGRPVDQIAAGMDGRVRTGTKTPPPWMHNQLLTAVQGLRAVTFDAAWALGDEARRGHLAPGTLGDVTILSGDVLDATPDEIRAMTVVATIVGGIAIYCADAEVCQKTD